MTQLRLWRRRHSQNIIAEATPVAGMGSWEVSVWQKGVRKTNGGRQFSLLTDAHTAADGLAAVTFGHQCDAGCGPWDPVERRQHPR
jgi:hypothetical protein